MSESFSSARFGKRVWLTRIFHHFTSRSDHLVCAAVATDQAIIIKTVMVNWTRREEGS